MNSIKFIFRFFLFVASLSAASAFAGEGGDPCCEAQGSNPQFPTSVDVPSVSLLFSDLNCRSEGTSSVSISGSIGGERLEQIVPIAPEKCAEILARVYKARCGGPTRFHGRFTVRRTTTTSLGFMQKVVYSIPDVDVHQFDDYGTRGRCLL